MLLIFAGTARHTFLEWVVALCLLLFTKHFSWLSVGRILDELRVPFKICTEKWRVKLCFIIFHWSFCFIYFKKIWRNWLHVKSKMTVYHKRLITGTKAAFHKSLYLPNEKDISKNPRKLVNCLFELSARLI